MKTALAALLLLSTAIPSRLSGQDDQFSRKTLVGLKGVYVLVEQIGDQAQRDGLSRDQVQTDVELRLRQAGVRVLSQEDALTTLGGAYLYIVVHAFKNPGGLYAFNVTVELKQRVTLARDSTITAVAATWSPEPILGTVGPEHLGTVRDAIRDLADQFVNAYLAANPKH